MRPINRVSSENGFLITIIGLTHSNSRCALADIGEAGEELQSAAAMLQSDEQGGPAIQLLTKVLGNIIASPAEPKFRCCHKS